MVKSQQWVLQSRPSDKMTEEHFSLQENDLGEVPDGGVLVRTVYLSVDPTQRIWASNIKQYMPNVAVGDVFRALGLGVVEQAKNNKHLKEGDYVIGVLGWQTHYISSTGDELNKVDSSQAPLEAHCSVLGLTGQTAYYVLKDEVKKNDTVLISAALGAVGTIAGQIARLLGAKKVVGIVGSDEKLQKAVQKYKYDSAINRCKETDMEAAIARECPEGVDVYLDNVGGDILSAALSNMNLFGRIPVCGMIQTYENMHGEAQRGHVKVDNMELLLMQRLTMRGYIIFDAQADPNFNQEFQKTVGTWLNEGKIAYEVSISEGIKEVLNAYNELFGTNKVGKKLVKVSEP